MTNSGPASLDSSLLARKGSATPAIPDESPLVLNLDEHRPTQTAAQPKQQETQPGTGGEQRPDDSAPRGAFAGLSRMPVRLRWAALAIVAGAIGIAAWLSLQQAEPLTGRQDAVVAPADVEEKGTAGLNLVTAGEAPAVTAPEGDRGAASEAAVPLPTSAAVAVTEPTVRVAGDAGLGLPGEQPEVAAAKRDSAAGTLLPVNVPPSDETAAGERADPAPIIEAAIPKAVAPIPVPKAKPRAAAGAGARYAIQLGSVGIEKRAAEEAFRLQKQFGDVLGGRTIHVESAQIAGKGTMYRLRADGYQTLSDARAACAQIERLKGSCLALRR